MLFESCQVPHKPHSRREDICKVKSETGVSTTFAGTGSKPPGSDLMVYSSDTFKYSKTSEFLCDDYHNKTLGIAT